MSRSYRWQANSSSKEPHMTTIHASAAARSETRADWLDAFAQAVGTENVLPADAPGIADYLDPYGFREKPAMPAAVVRPGSIEEVQRVLAIAREYRLVLWTVSRGRNFSYGGAEARLPDSVICDLSRMDRIISVDEENGAVLVEPGVSFQALDEHLRATGSKLAVSVPDLSWGSLIGNTLDRGMSYTAHHDHPGIQCGMEVVLGDGEVVRTGMGALPGNDTWPLYRGAFGPSLDGLFLQSNFGIVTKMGVWLRPRPERAAACTITVPENEQLGQLIETLRPLLQRDTIQSNVVIGNALAAGSLITPRSRFYEGDGLMPESAIRNMMREFHLGWWNAQFGVYGSPGMIAARIAEVELALEALPGAVLEVVEYPGDVDPKDVAPEHRTQIGVPSNEAAVMAAWRGGEPAHSDIGVVCPPTLADSHAVRGIVGQIVEAAGFDYAAGFMLNRRHVVALCLLTFDRNDLELRSRVGDVIGEVIRATASAGYGTYRSHLEHMDLAAAQFSFNDHAFMRVVERMKDALDPHGILSPGKQGIWPTGTLREEAHARRDALLAE
jgi:4-cresol dehydrogenase (hydroxylating) flavoprotein subunit